MALLTSLHFISCIGGDLHSYVARKNKLNGSEALFITYQLLLAMEVIHCNLRDLDRAEAKPLLSICTIHARLLIEVRLRHMPCNASRPYTDAWHRHQGMFI